jgi:penicillin amidase
MRRGFKIAIWMIMGFIAILIALGYWGYRTVIRSLPQTRGTLVIQALQKPVRIYRDGYHVPHILAEEESDCFFSQGFVTAQDRLWQMDMWRRAARGTLSEIFGPATVSMDSLMRVIGLQRTAESILPHLSPLSRRMYEAYTQGVNAYIQGQGNRLPVEFTLLNYTPDPWEVEDCVLILRWLGWQLCSGWKTDIVLSSLAQRLGMEKLTDLLPELRNESLWKNGPVFSLNRNQQNPASLALDLSATSRAAGSNAWAVSGEKTQTGKPILANDPHLWFQNPSVFYEIHMASDALNVTGFSIPGVPGVLLGRNSHIAWGLANSMGDDLDFYAETLSENDSGRYIYGHSTRPLKFIEETIRIRPDSVLVLKIAMTHRGPLFTDLPSQTISCDKPVSIRWAGYETSDEGLSIYRLIRAKNWEEFREALRSFCTPSLNMVYADIEGHIGVQSAGRFPLRRSRTGYLIRDGRRPENDWQGFVPFQALPSEKDPDRGYVATANEKICCPNPSQPFSGYWDSPFRARRIRSFIEEQDSLTWSHMKMLQEDILSLYAVDMMRITAPFLDSLRSDDPLVSEMAARMTRWDGMLRSGSSEAMVFQAFCSSMARHLFQDEMDETLFKEFMRLNTPAVETLLRVLGGKSSLWIDNPSTPEEETREDLIRKSFESAISRVREIMGDDTRQWTWGRVHTLIFRHPLGEHPLLRRTFNLGPVSLGGSGNTVNAASYDLSEPYEVLWGPAGRFIADMDNPDNTLSVIPTGQSGQPLDSHYRDQLKLYLNRLYHPNLMDTVKVNRSGWDLLTLTPPNENP